LHRQRGRTRRRRRAIAEHELDESAAEIAARRLRILCRARAAVRVGIDRHELGMGRTRAERARDERNRNHSLHRRTLNSFAATGATDRALAVQPIHRESSTEW
jgi:hypothetical protein